MDISFKGTSNEIVFDDIATIFKRRDEMRAREDALRRQEEAAMRQESYRQGRARVRTQPRRDEFTRRQETGRRVAQPQSAVIQRERSQYRSDSSYGYDRVRQGERPSARRTEVERPNARVQKKTRYKVKPRAYVLAAATLFTILKLAWPGAGTPANEVQGAQYSAYVESTENTSPYTYSDTFEFEASPQTENERPDEYTSPQISEHQTKMVEAAIMQGRVNTALENPITREVFYDLQKTIDRASSILDEPIMPLLEEICAEHTDGLDPIIPLIITFMESRGLHYDAVDGFMEMTPIAVEDVKERYPEYKDLNPENPEHNLILGTKFIEMCYNRYTDGSNRAMAARYNNCFDEQYIEGVKQVTKEWYGDRFVEYYNAVSENPELAAMLMDGLLCAIDGKETVEIR